MPSRPTSALGGHFQTGPAQDITRKVHRAPEQPAHTTLINRSVLELASAYTRIETARDFS